MLVRTDSILVSLTRRYRGLFCSATMQGLPQGFVRIFRRALH